MLESFRKHHKKWMIAVFIVIVVSFSVTGPSACSRRQPGEWYHVVNGRDYVEEDLRNAQETMQLAMRAFGQGDPTTDLYMTLASSGRRQDRDNSGVEQLISLITLRDEAAKLGISVSEEDITKGIESLSSLQTEGKFDRPKFDALFEGAKDPALAKKKFVAMIADALTLKKMQALVGGTLPATDLEVDQAYNRQNSIFTAQVVTLPRKEHEALKAEDKDVEDFYNKQKSKEKVEDMDPAVVTPASKDIRYVQFEKAKRDDLSKLPGDQQEAKKKEWDTADRQAAESAHRIMTLISVAEEGQTPLSLQAAVEAFKKEAEEKKQPVPALEIKNFANFHAENTPDELKAEEKAKQEVASAEKVGSIKLANGYIVFEVAAENPSKLMALDQVKAKVLDQLTKEKIDAAHQEKFNTVRNALETALTAKKSWEDALKDAGVSASTLVINSKKPDPAAPPYSTAVGQELVKLKSGTVAKNAVPHGDEKLLVYLAKREIMDDPKMADDKRNMKQNMAMKGGPFSPNPLFQNWFEARREAASPQYK